MQLRVIETLMLIFLMGTTGTVSLTEPTSVNSTTDPFQFEIGSFYFYMVMGVGALGSFILFVISIAIILSYIIYVRLRSRHPECLQCCVSCHAQVNSTLSLAEAAASNEEYKLEENSAYGPFRAQNSITSFTDSKGITVTITKGIYL